MLFKCRSSLIFYFPLTYSEVLSLLFAMLNSYHDYFSESALRDTFGVMVHPKTSSTLELSVLKFFHRKAA